MSWEEILNQFRQQIRGQIDTMEAEVIAALQVVINNAELAVQRREQLKTILGIPDDSSESRYLKRLAMTEALVAELRKIMKELGTDFST